MATSVTALAELNLYELLDPSNTLSTKSDSNDLRRAYHKQARALHPDKNPTIDPAIANERFDRLKKAYEILSDADKRADFDKLFTERNKKVLERENEDASIRTMREKLQQREKEAANASFHASHSASLHRSARDAADRRRHENESIVESMRNNAARNNAASPGLRQSPSFYQATTQPINQPINQSTISLTLSHVDTEKSLSNFFSQFGSIELILMRTKKAYITFFDRDAAVRAINQSINQPINQSGNQSISNDSITQAKFDHWKVQLVGQSSGNPSFNQSINQSVNQSINQPILTSYEALTEYETSTFARIKEAIRKRPRVH